MNNAIAKLCNLMLSNIYRVSIVCVMVSLKITKATLRSIDGRKQNVGDIENIGNDYISSQILVKREIIQKNKYSSSFIDVSSTRTKLNPGLLRERTNKNNQAKQFKSQYQNYMNFARAGFPKRYVLRIRFEPSPSDK